MDTVNTTMSIAYVSASTEKFQLISNRPETAQEPSVVAYAFPAMILGAIKTIENSRKPILTIVKFDSWVRWTRVPKRANVKKLISGKKTMDSSIL